MRAELQHKFHALDGLRGIAAIAVVIMHERRFFGNLQLPHAYLAVDFFFCLSGFVLSYAYQERLDNGLSLSQWMSIRFLRFYPLYLLGLLIGVTFVALRIHAGVEHDSVSQLLVTLGLNLFILPGVTSLLFFFDGPGWTLFFELAVNVLHRVFLVRASTKKLWTVAIASAVIMICIAVMTGTIHGGYERKSFFIGFPRVVVSYTIGCILLRKWKTAKRPWTVPPLLPSAVLIAAFAMPVPSRFPNIVSDLLCMLMIFPATVMAGAFAPETGRTARIAVLLGTLSYPLYILHIPLFEVLEQVWVRATHLRIEPFGALGGFTLLIVIIILSLLAAQADVPVRKLISRKFLPSSRRKTVDEFSGSRTKLWMGAD